MPVDPIFKLELTRGAVFMLEGFLRQARWATEEHLIDRAWTFICALREEFQGDRPPEEPKAMEGDSPEVKRLNEQAKLQYQQRCEEWVRLPTELQVTDEEREMARICIRYFTAQGAIEPSEHYNSLVEALRLVEPKLARR